MQDDIWVVASVAVGMVIASRLDLSPRSDAQTLVPQVGASAPATGPVDAQTFRTIAKAMTPTVVNIRTTSKRQTQDLADLMAGMLEANDRMRDDGLDPVLQAAATAFGFVYGHPFEDGNGRLHRCLIHHVLAERKFTPPGMVFPVSSVMLDRIDDYRSTLQAHSAPLMPFIDWRSTPERNVEVLNDTADMYRYFDCTEAAEFLYACVRRTVESDLPREIDYLRQQRDILKKTLGILSEPPTSGSNGLTR
jgi:Fic family protein